MTYSADLGDMKELEEHRASAICLGNFLRRAQEAGVINPKLNPRFVLVSLIHLCVMYLLNLPRYQWFLGPRRVTDRSAGISGICAPADC